MKKYALTLSAVIACALVLWVISEYRKQGILGYQKTFNLSVPKSTELVRLELRKELFSWSDRWSFKISPEEFRNLNEALKKENWSEWKEVDGSYGSFSQFSSAENPLLMSASDPTGMHKKMFFFRPSTGELDAISFRY